MGQETEQEDVMLLDVVWLFLAAIMLCITMAAFIDACRKNEGTALYKVFLFLGYAIWSFIFIVNMTDVLKKVFN